MALRAVTLDAAGTLFDVAEPVGRTYARFAARHGIPLAPDHAERAFRAAFAAAPPLAFPGRSAAGAAGDERAWWHAVVRDTFGPRADAPGFEACFAELFAHFGRAEAWRLFPEVRDALAQLRGRRLRLAVVSNFDGRLLEIVADLGIGALFDAIVPSTHAGAAKPEPAIFRAALAALNVEPAAALHAGDAVREDVEGACAAGLHAVLVDRRDLRPPVPAGTHSVTTLSTLAAVADALGTAA